MTLPSLSFFAQDIIAKVIIGSLGRDNPCSQFQALCLETLNIRANSVRPILSLSRISLISAGRFNTQDRESLNVGGFAIFVEDLIPFSFKVIKLLGMNSVLSDF